eukprot:gene864-869_t
MKLPKLSIKEKASVFFAVLALFGFGIQFTNPELKNPPVTGRLVAPKEVMQIYERACYDCHSNETQLTWYDKIAPVSWKVFADVRKARSRFNFSEWNKLTVKEQESILWETVNAILTKKMPLPDYLYAHPQANISTTELGILKKYVNSFQNSKKPDSASKAAATLAGNFQSTNHRFTSGSSDSIPVALNGVKYVDNYKHWQVMTKDDQQYPKTGGWGFAIFNGQRLLPAGKTPMFDAQCFNCHKMLASDNGYVFLVYMFRPEQREMFDAGHQEVGIGKHQAGEVYTLVTWHQLANPHWYGSNINGRIKIVETVKFSHSPSGVVVPKYTLFNEIAGIPDKNGSNQAAAKSVFDLKPKTAYSIYITDIPSKVNLLLTEDDLSRPATGKAKIRFINLSPDAGSLDLSILGDTTAIFTKTSFKSNTAFLQVNPSTAIGFAISDSTKTSLATSPKYRLEQGKIYTVIAKGLKSAADTTTKLAVGMIRNK